MTIVIGIKRFYIQDSYQISQNKENPSLKTMPDIFSLLVSNPLLERKLLEDKDSESTRGSEDLKALKKKNNKKDILHQLVVNIKTTKVQTDVDFLFNNFRVIANEKTVEKLVKILFNILATLDRKDGQLEKLKQEYIKYSMSESDQDVGPLKTDFQFVNAEQEKGIFESLKKVRENYLIKEKGVRVIKLEKLEEKARLNIEGTINNIEVWVPLDWNKEGSKHMAFAFSMNVSHSMFSHKNYYINNLTNLIFKVDAVDNVMDTEATLKNLIVKIEHFVSDPTKEETVESALIQSLREDCIRSHLLK